MPGTDREPMLRSSLWNSETVELKGYFNSFQMMCNPMSGLTHNRHSINVHGLELKMDTVLSRLGNHI